MESTRIAVKVSCGDSNATTNSAFQTCVAIFEMGCSPPIRAHLKHQNNPKRPNKIAPSGAMRPETDLLCEEPSVPGPTTKSNYPYRLQIANFTTPLMFIETFISEIGPKTKSTPIHWGIQIPT